MLHSFVAKQEKSLYSKKEITLEDIEKIPLNTQNATCKSQWKTEREHEGSINLLDDSTHPHNKLYQPHN